MKNTAPFHDTQTYPYPKPVTVVRVTHQEKYKYNLKTLVEAIEQKGKGTLAPQIKEGDIFFSALVYSALALLDRTQSRQREQSSSSLHVVSVPCKTVLFSKPFCLNGLCFKAGAT